MGFQEALDRVLPPDLPNRQRVIDQESSHLEAIVEANRYMNLTRITEADEAAVKHVYDSAVPWRLFAGAQQVLDAGTGAGFPGLPLAIVHPQIRWTLAESIGKKARFVEELADRLNLTNVRVLPERAETLAQRESFDIVTARAVAPLEKLTDLLMPAIKKGARLLLFKGPDADSEIAHIRDKAVIAESVYCYELPLGMGLRNIIEVRRRAGTPTRAAAMQR